MPGDKDPTNLMWPNQPLHSCMFPETKKTGNLNLVPNPYEASIDGRIVLGTDGTNLADIYRSVFILSKFVYIPGVMQINTPLHPF